MKIDPEHVRSKVVKYIDGKHGKIGIILPEHDPNPNDLTEIHRVVAEIAVKQAKRMLLDRQETEK